MSTKKKVLPVSGQLLLLFAMAMIWVMIQTTEVKADTLSGPRFSLNGVVTWDKVTFGNYWQTNHSEKEPVEWRVLAVEGSKVLLLSEKILDARKYNEADEKVTWETCTLRKWLNVDFYDAAFSEAEKAAIHLVALPGRYPDKGDAETADRVFILSNAELSRKEYGFPEAHCLVTSRYGSRYSADYDDSTTRTAVLTPFARERGVLDEYEGKGFWWQRWPALYNSALGCIVYYDGTVGVESYRTYNDESVGVRPAIQVELSAVSSKKCGTVSSEPYEIYKEIEELTYENTEFIGLKDKPYTGKPIVQDLTVKVSGTVLEEGRDYEIEYSANQKVGRAVILIRGKDGYSGSVTCGFQITKAANPVTAKGKTVKIKYKKLSGKNQTVTAKKALTIRKAQGSVTYKKKSGAKKITIHKKTGVITVKQGLKKGSYLLKVGITAAGNSNYKKKTVTAEVKIIVR